MWTYNYSSELYHTGVKGMKWGVRRAKKEEAKRIRRETYAKELEAQNNRTKNFIDAKKKAKTDPGYKNTPEYAKLKKDAGKHFASQVLFGPGGSELSAYKKANVAAGDSKGKATAKNAGILAASAAILILGSIAINKIQG